MPGKHHHGHGHPHLRRTPFLDSLQLLVDEGYARTTTDLMNLAERVNEADAAKFFGSEPIKDLPPELALRKYSVEQEIAAAQMLDEVRKGSRTQRVAMVLPLPPHVLELFEAVECQLLIPDNHDVPPHLRHLRQQAVRGTRACRQAVADRDVIVFEGYRKNGTLQVDPDIADIVDERILRREVTLFVHRRPHLHPDDVCLNCSLQVTFL